MHTRVKRRSNAYPHKLGPVNFRMRPYTAGPGFLEAAVTIPDWRRVS
jgi:hypothetical protein